MGANQSSASESAHRKRSDDAEELSQLVQTRQTPSSPSGDMASEDVYLSAAHSPRAVNRFTTTSSTDISPNLPQLPSALHTDMSSISVASTISPAASAVPIEPEKRFRILVLMSETGGGHRASAQALEAAFDQLYPAQTDITTVDFWVDVAGFPFHTFPQQYSYCAKRPLLWKFLYLWAKFRPTRALTELAFSLFCHAKVRRYFEAHQVDLIISVHPLVNTLSLSVLAYMRDLTGRPTPPYVTVVTDLGGAHPTWFDARADLIYVPSEPLRQLALESSVRDENIRLFGLPIRPSFWTESRSRKELRCELGMALNIPAVLLVGGGDGVGGLEAIASAIAAKIAEEVGAAGGQIVVVCGKNKSLLRKMQARSWPVPVILKGFVNNMNEWMSACDILCSKAGPGTIAEAWIRGLPIVLTGFLPGQEEGNVRLVTESGSGEYHASAEDIATCAARWVADPELRGAVADRARSLGRPNSSREIASDIWAIGQERLREREAFHRRMALSPVQHIPNGYIAMMRFYIGSAARSVNRGFWSMLGYVDPERVGPRE